MQSFTFEYNKILYILPFDPFCKKKKFLIFDAALNRQIWNSWTAAGKKFSVIGMRCIVFAEVKRPAYFKIYVLPYHFVLLTKVHHFE